MVRLGISNIAFESLPDGHTYVKRYEITNIELAPTTLCPWDQFTSQTIQTYEATHKCNVFSLQSIFYNTGIQIAKDPDQAIQHLTRVLQVCCETNVDKITFGSPKARVCTTDADRQTIHRVIKECALAFPAVTICIEPNAHVYGCNYITTLSEAISFVLDVNLPNVKIQLDVGNFILENDNLDMLKTHVYMLGAVHISDENLGPLVHEKSHTQIATFLKQIGYNGHISLEMRAPATLSELGKAIQLCKKLYDAKHRLPSCLVGYTGFVGSNLRDQRWFNEYVNRSNLHTIKNRDFSTVYFAAMPGSMWYANSHVDEDFKALQLYWSVIKTISARKFVLISSMNVYGNARSVTEIDLPEPCTTYGRHRLILEQLVQECFERYFIVRLPGLFGPHLKKNAIYDIANGHRLEFVNLAASYQWYNLVWLFGDLDAVWRNSDQHKEVLNITTPPVTTRELAAFSTRDISVCRDDPNTDNPLIQSKHGYLHTLEDVFAGIQVYFEETLAKTLK